MNAKFILTAFICLTSYALALGEEKKSADISDPKIPLWCAEVADNAKVVISAQGIVAVALHPYLLNGEIMVTEVTVDTVGNNTFRFYYIHEDAKTSSSPKDSASAGKQRAARTTTRQRNEATLPSIKFPEGAYAHSIEYQISSLEELNKIYTSLISVWERSSKRMTTIKLEPNKQ